jgi:ATP-dependent Clp protease ATP-binding subunit ClpC
MDSIEFNYRSARAEKARIGVALTKVWRGVLLTLAVFFMIVGVVLIFLGETFGWLVAGLSVIPAMVVEWYHGELRHIPTGKTQSTDALLSADVLGQLNKKPSPREIAMAISLVPGGRFLAIRFGLTANLLANITSEDAHDTPVVWQNALQVRDQTNSEHISGAVLAVALLRSFDGYENLLAHMQINADDLLAGICWYEHIRELVRRHNTPKRTGGIARDWSFGYIPLLTRFGQNISQEIAGGGLLKADIEAHTQTLDQLIETFGTSGRQNAVLVGPSGVGKTTIVHAFAERLLDAATQIPESLKFRQVFILDSAPIIAAAPGRGELENLVMQVLSEAFNAKNIIICLDNAQLFFEEGVGSVDLTNVLLPILEAGRLRIILTMDEQQFLQIGQRNPALMNALNRINVAPTNQEETMIILQDKIIILEHQHKVVYMYQALAEAYRLSERYVHDLAMPGRAVKLLESATGYNDDGLVTAQSVHQAIEKTMDIKVGVAKGEVERETLLNLEQLIHERMINQNRAVGVVSDALRRARAGVRNQNRPIGTFLFLGPTGVGKTELAKVLAEVYFGGENRIIRLDLNEYVTSSDVTRLIADGADNPTSLTAQVIKQPFSVILLDEIEKAHSQVLTTLLQMLDEGILRDIKNREISFRDAIVIATSNAGAERIREYIERGYQLEQFEQQFIDELIDSHQFRAEFLNRFDEIVVFQPLGQDELIQVVDLMIKNVNKTLALQKVSVEVAIDAKKYLVNKGYDPRLGARPMRRIIQRTVENAVAKQMLAGSIALGSVITITLEQIQQLLEARDTAGQIINDSKQEVEE